MLISLIFCCTDPWIAKDQIHWTNYCWQRCNFWSFLGGWELDSLWKILLVCFPPFSEHDFVDGLQRRILDFERYPGWLQ